MIAVDYYGKDDTLPTVQDRRVVINHNGVLKVANPFTGKFEPVNGVPGEINAQTGTTYTLVLDDAGRLVTCSNASAIALTVPPNVDVAFPIGTQIRILQGLAGQVTVTPGSGVTIDSPLSKTVTHSLNAMVTLIKTATNTWKLFGDLGVSGGVNLQTGTTYTFALVDAGETVVFNSGSAITATIPANASVAFPIGTVIRVLQTGAGKLTCAITTDTLNVVAGNAASAQHDGFELTKTTATTWNQVGYDASTIA